MLLPKYHNQHSAGDRAAVAALSNVELLAYMIFQGWVKTMPASFIASKVFS
jgi:hypothetical protein